MDEKQQKKLLKLADLADRGELAIVEYLFEIEEKIEAEIPSLKNLIERMRGEDGKDYVITDADKKEIANFTNELISRDDIKRDVLGDIDMKKIAELASAFIVVPAPEKIDTVKIEENVTKKVLNTIKIPKNGEDSDPDEVADLVTIRLQETLAQHGTNFRDGLELLEDDDRIDASAIKGLNERFDVFQFAIDNDIMPNLGGGSTARNLYQLFDVEVSGVSDNDILQYNSATGLWENVTPQSIEEVTLAEVSGYSTTTPKSTYTGTSGVDPDFQSSGGNSILKLNEVAENVTVFNELEIGTTLGKVVAGDTTGNARGADSLDIQSSRSAVTEVASGACASAFGLCNTASGAYSTAVGRLNTASVDGSSAVGYLNTASGNYSSAFGRNNTAQASCGSAVGYQNCACTGPGASAVGYLNVATGINAGAIGNINLASGRCSSAVGVCSTASGNRSSASGYRATASGYQSTSMGYNSSAGSTKSTSIGTNTSASAVCSTALGACSKATSACGSAVGFASCACIGAGASAVGYSNVATGAQSTAMGYLNTVAGTNASAFGRSNTASGTRSSALGYNNTASLDNSSAFGYNNTASGCYSSAFGFCNTTAGNFAIASGYCNSAHSSCGTAVGFKNCACISAGASAVGTCNVATAGNASAIGNLNIASCGRASAIGRNNTASGCSSSAVGYSNTASAYHSSAFGTNVNNSTADSVEMGPSDTAKIQTTATYNRPATDNTQSSGDATHRWTGVYAGNYISTVSTLANEATPTVAGAGNLLTGGTTAITDFDDGVVGQTISMLAKHSITITHGTPIQLAGAGDFVMTSGNTLTLTMFETGVWQEVSRK